MRTFVEMKRQAAQWIGRFVGHKRGNVAMMFGITTVSVVLAAGAGVDFARAISARSRLSEALDAAGLAVGTSQGLTQLQLETMAQQYFDANYPVDTIGTPGPVSVIVNGQTISLSVDAQVPTTLLKVLQIDNINLTVSNQIVRAVTKLRVALVLDNTGSMSETDATGTSKISALISATHQLLTQLQGASHDRSTDARRRVVRTPTPGRQAGQVMGRIAIPPARQHLPGDAELVTQRRQRNALFVQRHQFRAKNRVMCHTTHRSPPCDRILGV